MAARMEASDLVKIPLAPQKLMFWTHDVGLGMLSSVLFLAVTTPKNRAMLLRTLFSCEDIWIFIFSSELCNSILHCAQSNQGSHFTTVQPCNAAGATSCRITTRCMNENSTLLFCIAIQELPKDVSAAALASPADSITAELGAAMKPAKSKNLCYEQAEGT